MRFLEENLGVESDQVEAVLGNHKDEGKIVANQEQLDLLKQGVEIWNQWRQECSSVEGINLEYATLVSVDLESADLEDTNLQDANLSGASLRGAILIDADLGGANLNSASPNS